jgi:outer membrane immunogenic protein
MKRILLSALLIASSVPAFAADLPRKAAPMPPPLPIYNWSGFYIGANLGYSAGRSSREIGFFDNLTGLPILGGLGSNLTGDGSRLDGWLFGGQIGYNWNTPGSSWVWGFETDAQWTNQRGSSNFICGGLVCLPGVTALPVGIFGTTARIDEKLTWFGTFRGRGGILVSPTFLLYATGGAAYGSVKRDVGLGTFTAAGLPVAVVGSTDTTKFGWTIGGGAEWAFGTNWRAKFEYLYMDLGSTSSTANLVTLSRIGANVNSRLTDNILRLGINYSFATY